jgi:uncharacterized protein involved in exopolysaccharide biosynthesis
MEMNAHMETQQDALPLKAYLEPPQQDALPLRAYLSMIYRRKFTVLSVFLLTTTAVSLGAILFPSQFTAQSTLIVRLGREFTYRPELGESAAPPALKLTEFVNSVVEILTSRELSRHVVEELGIDKLYPSILEDEPDQKKATAKAVGELQSHTAVKAVLDSSIIKITLDHENPEMAAKALNLLVDKFKEKHLEVFSEERTAFVESQLKDQEEQLVKAENALATFKNQEGIHEIPEQKRLVLTERFRQEAALRDNDLKIAELKASMATLKVADGSSKDLLPASVIADQKAALGARRKDLYGLRSTYDLKVAELEQRLLLLNAPQKEGRALPSVPGMERWKFLDDAWTRLLDLELKQKDLMTNYREGSREVTSVRSGIQQIASFLKDRGVDLRKLVEAGVQEELTPLKAALVKLDKDLAEINLQETTLSYQDVLGQLAPLTAKRESILAEIDRLKSDMEKLDANEKNLRPLEREVALHEKNVQLFAEEFGKARITDELDKRKMVNIKVIEPAEVPILSSGLSKKMKIALGMFAGMLAGVTAAFILDLVKR